MTTKSKFTAVTVIFALVAFSLSRVIWPDPMEGMAPTAAQLPFFIFLSILEALLFGAGVAFLVFGREIWQKGDRLTKAAFLSVVWAMVTWWPHDNMHRSLPMGDYAGLLRIEYIFHFTLYVVAIILARYVWVNFGKTKAVSQA